MFRNNLSLISLWILIVATSVAADTPFRKLRVAIGSDQTEQVRKLLDQQPGLVNETDISGKTPLWIAIEVKASQPIIALLLDSGADLDDVFNGKPLLHAAAEKAEPEVVNLLLRRGANTKRVDKEGCSALNHGRHPDTLKLLVKAGLDPSRANTAGSTPLHSNALRPACVSFLVSKKVPIDVQDQSGRTPLYLATCAPKSAATLINSGANSALADTGGNSPLHFACYHGHLESIELLLEAGADPNAKNLLGSIPLQHLVMGLKSRLGRGTVGCGYSGKRRALYANEVEPLARTLSLMKQKGLDKSVRDKEGTAQERAARVPGLEKFVELLDKL